jgi:hypothetical protein
VNLVLSDFVDRIYPIELDIKDIINIDKSSTYIDLNLEFDNEGRLRMRLYDKRDDFNCLIVNFPWKLLNQVQHYLVNRYIIFESQMTTGMLHLS